MNGSGQSASASQLANKRVLIVGMGGLGCPAAMALIDAGVGHLSLCDDDRVDETNLHRQVLYERDDIGEDKLQSAKKRLLTRRPNATITLASRFLPENARALVQGQDVVIEGADNFATKFLAADACYLESVPIVHGAAVRFVGTAFSVSARGAPCYRCVFEDMLPADQAPNCAAAGVMGPVVGVVGALLADLAIDNLLGHVDRVGHVFSFDGKRGRLRESAMVQRPGCPLCGSSTETKITQLTRELYGAAPAGPGSSYGAQSPSCN